ncbi:MAG: peptide methionine sulfoxide reductase MsrA [Alphaproteobacteria bacterium]|nr:MAG: peptide methionine sulfoxide reductase MsrA [Alphaproteobacteria bacterium]
MHAQPVNRENPTVNRTTFALVAVAIAAALPHPAQAELRTAIFAGGCFWCMESDFESVDGVVDVVSGYTGGSLTNPTYRNHEGHVEAVRISYDDTKVTYEQLLHTFWRVVDPTDAGGQFCDRGHSYTTAIFALDAGQKQAAEASKAEIGASDRLGAPVVTPVLDAGLFTEAEDYHQDYYRKNPVRYSFYRRGCGRDARIRALWGAEAHAGVAHKG